METSEQLSMIFPVYVSLLYLFFSFYLTDRNSNALRGSPSKTSELIKIIGIPKTISGGILKIKKLGDYYEKDINGYRNTCDYSLRDVHPAAAPGRL